MSAPMYNDVQERTREELISEMAQADEVLNDMDFEDFRSLNCEEFAWEYERIVGNHVETWDSTRDTFEVS